MNSILLNLLQDTLKLVLVKKLEELGIGRPSTYASIISVISTRGYVEPINKKFHPTDRGKLISAFLRKTYSLNMLITTLLQV